MRKNNMQPEPPCEEVSKLPEISPFAAKPMNKHWRKIKLMLHYLKMKSPGIINMSSSKSTGDPTEGIKMNLQAIHMVDKYKEFLTKEKTDIPRCGGQRAKGQFDYQG